MEAEQNVVIQNSTLKRKKILTYATTWINLKDIMLSEISHLQNNTHYMISLICSTYNSQKTK